MTEFTKQQVTESLQRFTSCRDTLLHEDEGFTHNLHRFIGFCQKDPLTQSVLLPLFDKRSLNADLWWKETCQQADRWITKLPLPDDPVEELILRYDLLILADTQEDWISQFGMAFGKHNTSEWVNIFLVLIVRPFANELSRYLAEAANLVSPEERALQAVPLSRIPKESEVRVFLSHKSIDKPHVYLYFNVLKELGFDPWLDERAMPAGANLEREILRGFEESCAAVFFITENFKDERYLATEVDYAVVQKRRKGTRFAIITLLYSDAVPVPGLLAPFIYKTVLNDLEGFHELLRALPIELGPVRWKEGIVE